MIKELQKVQHSQDNLLYNKSRTEMIDRGIEADNEKLRKAGSIIPPEGELSYKDPYTNSQSNDNIVSNDVPRDWNNELTDEEATAQIKLQDRQEQTAKWVAENQDKIQSDINKGTKGKSYEVNPGSIDYSDDNVFGRATPNEQFMAPNLTGEAQKKVTDYNNEWIQAFAPIPGVDQALGALGKGVKGTSKAKAAKVLEEINIVPEATKVSKSVDNALHEVKPHETHEFLFKDNDGWSVKQTMRADDALEFAKNNNYKAYHPVSNKEINVSKSNIIDDIKNDLPVRNKDLAKHIEENDGLREYLTRHLKDTGVRLDVDGMNLQRSQPRIKELVSEANKEIELANRFGIKSDYNNLNKIGDKVLEKVDKTIGFVNPDYNTLESVQSTLSKNFTLQSVLNDYVKRLDLSKKFGVTNDYFKNANFKAFDYIGKSTKELEAESILNFKNSAKRIGSLSESEFTAAANKLNKGTEHQKLSETLNKLYHDNNVVSDNFFMSEAANKKLTRLKFIEGVPDKEITNIADKLDLSPNNPVLFNLSSELSNKAGQANYKTISEFNGLISEYTNNLKILTNSEEFKGINELAKSSNKNMAIVDDVINGIDFSSKKSMSSAVDKLKKASTMSDINKATYNALKPEAQSIINKYSENIHKLKLDSDGNIDLSNMSFNDASDIFTIKSDVNTIHTRTTSLKGFIDYEKQFNSSKIIQEHVKKKFNIKYDPKEAYDRGAIFVHQPGKFVKDKNISIDELLSNSNIEALNNSKQGIDHLTSTTIKNYDELMKSKGNNIYKIIKPSSDDIVTSHVSDAFTGSGAGDLFKTQGAQNTKYPIAPENISSSIAESSKGLMNETVVKTKANNYRWHYNGTDKEYIRKVAKSNAELDAKYGKLDFSDINNLKGAESIDNKRAVTSEIKSYISTHKNDILKSSGKSDVLNKRTISNIKMLTKGGIKVLLPAMSATEFASLKKYAKENDIKLENK